MDEIIKAGKICKEIKKKLPSFIKPDLSILGAAEWIEAEIKKAGGLPSFPVNISINEIAAHFSPMPKYEGVFKQGDMVKVDFGAHIDGFPSDNAVSFDLGENEELFLASKDALAAATEVILSRGADSTLSEIGSAIEKAITTRGFNPITNLTGHSIAQWNLHDGLSILNYDSGSDRKIGEGIIAIEPFATNGEGRVKNGQSSEIYRLVSRRPQRLPNLRKLVNEIVKFKTLPFCSRWVSKPEYLRMLVKSETLHNYPLLVEVSGGMVSQAEDTFYIKDGKVTIVT